MEQTYDAIVLGTGLKEGILSALLSVHGKKVLHMDRNKYYGGDCASLRLTQLYEFFNEDPATIPKNFGKDGDWNVDMIPKFILASGDLMKTLTHADCLMYLDFGKVAGSFVYSKNEIQKVPSTVKEALTSKLMGLFEKKRMGSFLQDINDYLYNNKPMKLDPTKCTCSELFDSYKFEPGTREFLLHAMALQTNDMALRQVALPILEKIQLYGASTQRYGSSPYIYPIYGLGDIPQAFARLSAVWGGTYMLDKQVDEILINDGKVEGVRCGDEKVYSKIVIGDPSYFPDLVQSVGKVGRGICILQGAIKRCVDQSDQEKDQDGNLIQHTSAQIIIPGSQCDRDDDIYVTTQGFNHRTTPKNLCIGFVSGQVQGNDQKELKAGFELLNQAGILKSFYRTTDIYVPKPEAKDMNIFISKSYDATSHFESTIKDALEMYTLISGEVLDLNSKIQRPQPQQVPPIQEVTENVEE
ncbi:Rab GDP dissociation inhibitor [Spironucleus salmonicida]|uniref:Rab GDP dissociation inhibitor n=1 Tax=Spironucleus salmonicida TaxID=348837 RepID=V6LJ67_9EUKA|nr:Rab GDP dissociation inhibitor [Spironucleus salmonicida]|eukprot:EST44617.1 Rab GDP dissociation inhibitor [Spironucleus salmonicida]